MRWKHCCAMANSHAHSYHNICTPLSFIHVSTRTRLSICYSLKQLTIKTHVCGKVRECLQKYVQCCEQHLLMKWYAVCQHSNCFQSLRQARHQLMNKVAVNIQEICNNLSCARCSCQSILTDDLAYVKWQQNLFHDCCLMTKSMMMYLSLCSHAMENAYFLLTS